MKDIPLVHVKANQAGIVAFVLAAIVLQMPSILLLLWVIQMSGLLIGNKGSLFVIFAEPFLRGRAETGEKQSAELTRFNNRLGVTMLTVGLLAFAAGLPVVGYVFAAMFGLAALTALFGYCVGCTVYYRYKQWKLRRH